LWSRNYPYNADSGAEFYGTKGKMMLSKRGKLEVYDDNNKRLPAPKPKEPASLVVDDHYRDFVDAIRTNRRPNADIEIGFQSAALCNLGNLATRLGRTIELAPQTLKVKNDVEANELLGREYRAGGHWAIPQGVPV
ncbi:gfo/Idh/MocA family oxidoreductase, partial [Planctomycetota bacterium]